MGSVFKRGKCWYIDYYADGKRHRESQGKHKKFAELRLKEIEIQIAREELKIPKDAAIDEFFENFLTYAEAHLSPKTRERYVTVINCFERFRSGYKRINRLSKITPAFLESFKLGRVRKVSKATVNHDLKVLSIVFNWAVKQNLIKDNPLKSVERFSIDKRYPKFFSPEEARLILIECSTRWYPAYMILLHTGIRKGELTNFEWNDVDFERRIIRINSKEDWSPKGKRDREIPIDNELLKILRELRQRSKGRYVLEVNGIKRKRYDWILWNNFRKLAKELGIEGVNIHTFRHTYCSYLIMEGVPLATVMDILGHRDIKTTMRYAHLAPGHKHWAVNRINSILKTDKNMGTNWAQSEKFVM